MNTRILLGASLAALFLSTAAYAANTMPSDQCSALIKQFDQAVTSHSTAVKLNDAKTLRTDGGKMCQTANFEAGITKLKQALQDIGVTPQS